MGTVAIARCLLRRHRTYATRHWLYMGMGWGPTLHRNTRAWYLWRIAQRAPAHVAVVALAMHSRWGPHATAN